jgi:8-oxo-dGTP pyrophosphatase MutT (NUDIX family)
MQVLFDAEAQPWVVASQGLQVLSPENLSVAAIRELWRRQDTWAPPCGAPHAHHDEATAPPISAAVLIPLVVRTTGVTVMLTQRSTHVHHHAGQISFPGGRIEQTDTSPVAAALRETQEETGLNAEWVEVLGTMPLYLTTTGFSITPVVSLVEPGFVLRPEAVEVAEVFEVPLSFIGDPANHRLHRVELPEGQVRYFYSILWKHYFIWGATAAILRNLYYLLSGIVASQNKLLGVSINGDRIFCQDTCV